MKGNILNYNIEDSSGIISGDDEQRYTFLNSEWRDDKTPKANQKVDFVINGNEAKDIYIVSEDKVSINTDEIKEKFDNFKNSENVQNAQLSVNNALKDGIQNKFGFIVSIVMAFSLFLPVVVVPFLGSVSLFDGGWGKATFFGLIVIAVHFYAGMKKQYLKIAVGIVSFMLFIQFYDLISSLIEGSNALNSFSGRRSSNINLLELLKIGTYILIPMTFVLLFTGFKAKYVEKEDK